MATPPPLSPAHTTLLAAAAAAGSTPQKLEVTARRVGISATRRPMELFFSLFIWGAPGERQTGRLVLQGRQLSRRSSAEPAVAAARPPRSQTQGLAALEERGLAAAGAVRLST